MSAIVALWLAGQGLTGKGVNVAIVDQPLFQDHPEFAGELWLIMTRVAMTLKWENLDMLSRGKSSCFNRVLSTAAGTNSPAPLRRAAWETMNAVPSGTSTQHYNNNYGSQKEELPCHVQ